MNLKVLAKKFAIYKFAPDVTLPGWIYSSEFYSITRTTEETSVVCVQRDENHDEIICSKDWRIIKIDDMPDLSSIGIIAEISDILAGRNIPVFTISTYNTDYFLVRQQDLTETTSLLTDKGHKIINQN